MSFSAITPKRGPGRPKAYKLPDGSRVPGVTTILGRFKESGGLIRWAYQQGLEGCELYEKRDTAADIGSVVHDMAEAMIHGDDVERAFLTASADIELDDEVEGKIRAGFAAFSKWFSTARVEVIVTETPYVSQKDRFGGTVDAIGMFDGSLCILDWKTSKSVYTDYLTQVAAYAILWEEAHPEAPIRGFHICRFNKNSGGFAHHFYPELKVAREMFLHLRSAYDLDRKLKDIL